MTIQTGTKPSSEEAFYAKLLIIDCFSLPYIKHSPLLDISFYFAAFTLQGWLYINYLIINYYLTFLISQGWYAWHFLLFCCFYFMRLVIRNCLAHLKIHSRCQCNFIRCLHIMCIYYGLFYVDDLLRSEVLLHFVTSQMHHSALNCHPYTVDIVEMQ